MKKKGKGKAVEQQKPKKDEKAKVSSLKPTTVKNLIKEFIEKETQVTPEAINTIQQVLIEITKWIAIDSEKLARYKGTKTITEDHIRASVRNYLGGKK